MAETFGRYELLKRLGGGGMGEVFLARQKGLEGFEKLLVVKTLHPHLADDAEFKSMFLDEARLAAQLIHPNIAQIHDLGDEEGTLYMAMEYIAGDDLKEIGEKAQEKGKPMPPALAARAIADAAAGLHTAHTATDHSGNRLGVIHRDVSPHNILVTWDGGVKVIDFGVAKATGRMTKTQTGALKGKFAYMSPEQVAGEELDARSDVFALGIVLWEVLCGRQLFKAENEMLTLMMVNEAKVEPPSTVNPQVPADLDPIVLKALAKDRNERFESAQALRMALEDWIAQSRAPASSAHLAAYVQDVYAEKYEKHRAQGPLSDLPPADAPVRSVRAARKGDTQAPATVATQKTGEAPAKSKWVPFAVGGAVVVAATLWLALRPGPAPEQPVAVAAPVAKPTTATVRITVVPPSARLVVNGAEVAPGVPVEAPPGEVKVQASAEGWIEDGRTYSVVAGQMLEDRLELKRAPAVLTINSTPPGATVLRDGQELGQTPLSLPVERDAPVELVFKLAGHGDEKRAWKPGGDETVEVTLKKLQAKAKPVAAPEIKMTR